LGEPTANLVNPDWSVWSVDGSGQGTIGTRTLLSTHHCRIVDVNANTRQYIFVEGVSANTQYTFSVKFLKITGAPTLRFQLQAYNGGSYISAWFPTTVQIGVADIDGWQTAEYTVTTPANTTRVLWFMQDGDDYTTYTHSFELKEPQAEANSHPTQFTAGTRSATQGLKDLTAKNTVNISTVSFDSNAQMTFDGTDDYALTSNFPALSNWSTEVWLNPSVYTSAQKVLLDVNLGIRFEISNGYFNSHFGNGSGWIYTNLPSTTQIAANKWFHVVVTVQSGGQAKVYVNGALENTLSIGSGTTPNIPLYIGRYTGASGYEFNGNLSVVKIYGQALTADQVQRNFNAVKSRFNIS
jgi:hypothetical protein